ncbi:MAG: hypothetical protein ACREQ5_07765 [Candidatus Dormibacteria bacterium]
MLDKKDVAAAISEGAFTEATKSFERLTQKTDTIAKLRLEFFDRIVLLDGGTVALSVTLISSFASKSTHGLKSILLLVFSWSAFLLSMVLALTRNWFEHDRLGKAETNNYLIAVQQSSKALLNLGKDVSGSCPEVEQMQKVIEQGDTVFKTEQEKHESLLFWTKVAGIASLVATLLGFILLLFFAVKNISLL